MLCHGVAVGLQSLLGVLVPALTCQEGDILEAVDLYQMLHQLHHRGVAVGENTGEVGAVLFDDQHRLARKGLAEALLKALPLAGGLNGILKYHQPVEAGGLYEGEYICLAALALGGILIFAVHRKDADVHIKAECLCEKSGDEGALICLVRLPDEKCYAYSSFSHVDPPYATPWQCFITL